MVQFGISIMFFKMKYHSKQFNCDAVYDTALKSYGDKSTIIKKQFYHTDQAIINE